MKKSVLVLLDDYWHPADTIEPLLKLLFDEKDWFVKVTDNPNYIGASTISPDLILNFKDGIANTSIQSPNWYETNAFPPNLLSPVFHDGGTGYIGIHCGLANIPENHPVFTELLHGRFVSHPPKCPVKIHFIAQHPITAGVEDFEIEDEHYQMVGNWDKTQVLAESSSVHSTQPAVWAHEYGTARVAAITPGHTTDVLTHPQMLRLFRNTIRWAVRK